MLAELLLELGIPAPADPLDVETNLGNIPVLVDIPPIRLANHLHGVEPDGRNFSHLGRYDREAVGDLGLAVGVFIGGVVGPPPSPRPRPDEPRLWRTHARLDFLLPHGTRPMKLSCVEVLQVAHPDQIERDLVDLADLDDLHGLGARLGPARPPVHPAVPWPPLRG